MFFFQFLIQLLFPCPGMPLPSHISNKKIQTAFLRGAYGSYTMTDSHHLKSCSSSNISISKINKLSPLRRKGYCAFLTTARKVCISWIREYPLLRSTGLGDVAEYLQKS